MSDLAGIIDFQIGHQGVSVHTVSDGTVFVFSLATLERLADAARESGKAILFVKRGVVQ